MRVWMATFKGRYLGGDAVIVAKDAEVARRMLDAELVRLGLEQTRDWPVEMEEVQMGYPVVKIISNGDY